MRSFVLLLLISYSMLFVCSIYGADEIQALNDRGGGGTYGTSGMWLLTSAGVVAELDPSEPPDFLEFLIQDDLSSMLSFTCNFQGYSED